jgi:hypothetical protein
MCTFDRLHSIRLNHSHFRRYSDGSLKRNKLLFAAFSLQTRLDRLAFAQMFRLPRIHFVCRSLPSPYLHLFTLSLSLSLPPPLDSITVFVPCLLNLSSSSSLVHSNIACSQPTLFSPPIIVLPSLPLAAILPFDVLHSISKAT